MQHTEPIATEPADLRDVSSVCDLVRTTLGPSGEGKLVIQDDGTVSLTTSGSAVLEELAVDHPTVTLLRTAATDARAELGDGTATLVAIVGALVDEAHELRELGVHPTTIERGYRRAVDVATDALDANAIATSSNASEAVAANESEAVAANPFAPVARTALTSTRDPNVRQYVGEQLSDAVAAIGTRRQLGTFEPDDVKVIARLGNATSETELVAGVVLDADPVHEGMARTVRDAGVAVLSASVDIDAVGTATARRDDLSVTLHADSFETREEMGKEERATFRRTLQDAIDAGCRCVVTAGAINDRVKTTLANHDVVAIHKIDEADLGRLARATGATVLPGLDQVTAETLGTATVSVRRQAGRDMTFFETADDAGVYTLLCRAPDPRTVEDFRRSVEGALAAVVHAERSGEVVPGGGAIELAAARRVRSRSRSIDDASQLPMAAFADALTVVPRTLAENAGLDSLDAVSRMETAHADGNPTVGIDAAGGTVSDATADDQILDPAPLKRAVWRSATDLAVKLVRIDAQVSATELGERE